MELPQCPYCYAPVHIWEDGICPACKQNTKLAPLENLQYASVEIHANQMLPECCIRCGHDTDQVEYFEYRYDSHLGDRLDEKTQMIFSIFTVLTVGFGLLLLPLYRKHLRKQREIVYHIHLNYCDACLPHKAAYRPITIEGRAFHFKAHKNFKVQLKALTPNKAKLPG